MNILEQIVAEKRLWIAARKKAQPLESFREQIVASDRDFYATLEKRKHDGVPAFICECKKASPSQGLIRANFDPAEIAETYARYADVVSVLCDEKFFQGRYENLTLVREKLAQPTLCKDFIVDSYQIFLARFFGADAVLLMLSVLEDADYERLAATAHALGMGVLTEADAPEDIARANRLGARVIGVNNRNLRTLKTDVSRTKELSSAIRPDAVRVAESGMRAHADVAATVPAADAFLVGTSLMREQRLDRACRKLIFGENKVCGLTRAQDAQAARRAGAIFGGLIFAEKSPRKISRERAAEIVAAEPELDFVGVFQNDAAEKIAETAERLGLFAVQLHGDETEEFAKKLRENLRAGTQIWKAISVEKPLPASDFFENPVFDRFVFDSGNGGTGTAFDREKLFPENLKSHALLAGGISPQNAREAHRFGSLGLDINSGAETSPGIKSESKLLEIFSEIRKF